MARTIKEMAITARLIKNGGEVEVETTADLTLGYTEYPELGHRKGVILENTEGEKTSIIKYAKNKLTEVMADQVAEDGIEG